MDCFRSDSLSPFILIGAGVVFIASTVIYRLYLHDLQDFPGPRLAACTSLYKTYYEVLKGGELLQHLLELHEKYGMYYLLRYTFSTWNNKQGKPRERV